MATKMATERISPGSATADGHAFKKAIHRLWLPFVLLALAFVAIGFAAAKGGLVGTIIFGAVALVLLALPLLDKTGLNPDSWLKGYFGERMVSNLLRQLPETFTSTDDITIASNGHTSNIDHLVVGPTGIWVIETKHWNGTFQRRGERLFLRGGDKTDHVNRTVAAAMHVKQHLDNAGLSGTWINAVVVSVKATVPDSRLQIAHATVVAASDVVPLIRGGPQSLQAADMRKARDALANLGAD